MGPRKPWRISGFPPVVRALSGWEAAAGWQQELALEEPHSSGWLPQKAILHHPSSVNVEGPSILLPVFCFTFFSDSHFHTDKNEEAKTSDLGVRMVKIDPSHPEEDTKKQLMKRRFSHLQILKRKGSFDNRAIVGPYQRNNTTPTSYVGSPGFSWAVDDAWGELNWRENARRSGVDLESLAGCFGCLSSGGFHKWGYPKMVGF